MKIDREKVQRYLFEIQARQREILVLLEENKDDEILYDPWMVKGVKYTLIEMAEAMANVLQHIIAKDFGEPVTGYVETIIRAGEKSVLSKDLTDRLRPFFDFRNSLIHRYWFISDERLLKMVRKNHSDFLSFSNEIEAHIKKNS